MDIGEKIRRTREEVGLSQTELAQLAGCSSPSIYRIEKGDDISLSTIMKVAGALDMSLILIDRETEFENELQELERKRAELESMISSRRKLLDDYRMRRSKKE